jgi:hypothetical protein
MILNLIMAFLGNAVGAALFVAGAYWYLYGKAAQPVIATPSRNGARTPPMAEEHPAR